MAQLADQAGTFRQRYEICGRDQAAIGMVPADQGFGAINLPITEAKLWLASQYPTFFIKPNLTANFEGFWR